MGYHKTDIKKGVLGEISKIQEELDELADAKEQSNKILELCELSDLIGAIDFYLSKHHAGFNIYDLIKMAVATSSAFRAGERK